MTVNLMNGLHAPVKFHVTAATENGDVPWGIIPRILITVMPIYARLSANDTRTKGVEATRAIPFRIRTSRITFPGIVLLATMGGNLAPVKTPIGSRNAMPTLIFSAGMTELAASNTLADLTAWTDVWHISSCLICHILTDYVIKSKGICPVSSLERRRVSAAWRLCIVWSILT
jgi:hypothetical protein